MIAADVEPRIELSEQPAGQREVRQHPAYGDAQDERTDRRS